MITFRSRLEHSVTRRVTRLPVCRSTPAGRATSLELTAQLRLNHNAIRQHLAKLVAPSWGLDQAATNSGLGGRARYVVDPRPTTVGR